MKVSEVNPAPGSPGKIKVDATLDLGLPPPGRPRGGSGIRNASGQRALDPRVSAFTLVELLTVIAIIAILASLLMTAVASAKKKSRAIVCTFNLHQISLALDVYLDDFGKRPPDVGDLVSAKYLTEPRSLICPEDKTGNWGRLVSLGNPSNAFMWLIQPGWVSSSNSAGALRYSYLLHPLNWDELMWNRLMQTGGSAGVAACQLHGLGKQDNPDVHNYSGLLLRAQRDGAVVRRQLFWNATFALANSNDGYVLVPNSAYHGNLPDPYAFQLFLDDPATWLQSAP